MKTRRILLCVGLAFFLVVPTFAKTKGKNTKAQNSKARKSLSLRLSPELLTRPKHMLTADEYYARYVGGKDNEIAERYQGAWTWDDKYRPYYPFQSRHVLVDRNFQFNQRDDLDRTSYARDIVRQRIDFFIRKQFEQIREPRPVKTVRSVTETVRNVPIALSSENKRAGELRVGYDILSDASKLEYANAPIEASLRHPELFGALTGQKPKLDLTQLGVNTNLDSALPRAGVQIPLNLQFMNATLSKSLSPTMEVQLSKRQPLYDRTLSHDYEIRLNWSF